MKEYLYRGEREKESGGGRGKCLEYGDDYAMKAPQ
jgi:hypothetical protein